MTTAAGYWGGSKSTWTTTYTKDVTATGTSSWSLTLPSLTYGQYVVRATAWDKAGNATPSANLTFWKSTGTSSLLLSSSSALTSGNCVKLVFSAALDGTIASSPLRYTVNVNGGLVSVQSVTYDSIAHSVTLALAPGALAASDSVVINWSNLFDTSGRALTGHTGTMIAG